MSASTPPLETSLTPKQTTLSAMSDGANLKNNIETVSARPVWMPVMTEEDIAEMEAWDRGVVNEAARLKSRLSHIPFYAKRAERDGEDYWLRLAGSYQGI